MLWNFKSSNSLQGEDKNSKKKNDPSLLFIAAKNSIEMLIINIIISYVFSHLNCGSSPKEYNAWIGVEKKNKNKNPEVVRKFLSGRFVFPKFAKLKI